MKVYKEFASIAHGSKEQLKFMQWSMLEVEDIYKVGVTVLLIVLHNKLYFSVCIRHGQMASS